MIFAGGRICHDRIGDSAVGYLVLAHFHRHRHHRRHGLDTRNIDLRELLDKSQHGIELTAKVLDLVVGDRYASKMRNPADGIGVNGHAKARPSIEMLAEAIPEVEERANGRDRRLAHALPGGLGPSSYRP